MDDAPGTDALALPVIDPWLIDPDYAPTIPARRRSRSLAWKRMQGRAQLWAVVTVPHDDPKNATVNLLAPLLINRESRHGRQVPLLGDKYQLRTPLKAASVRERARAARTGSLSSAFDSASRGGGGLISRLLSGRMAFFRYLSETAPTFHVGAVCLSRGCIST